MISKCRVRTLLLCCSLAAVFSAMGCNSGGDDNNDPPSSGGEINLSGGFFGQRSNTNGSAEVQFDFDQTGNDLSGSFTDSSLGSGMINGSITSNRLSFLTILNAGDLLLEWDGTSNEDATALQGNWRIIIGGSASGEWSASR